MSAVFDKSSPKKPLNVTLNSDLLEQARRFNMNISAVLEKALAESIRQEKKKTWIEEIKASIEKYNRHIHETGLFSDDIRTF